MMNFFLFLLGILSGLSGLLGCNEMKTGKELQNGASVMLDVSPNSTLEKVCQIFSENWQSLRYHYKDKELFLKECQSTIVGMNLVEGLWTIRRLIPDGHADFEIENSSDHSRIHPFLLQYDGMTRTLQVGASFDPSLNEYVGKQVRTINGQPAMEILKKRAELEPQSTLTSSLEIAARTLTFSLATKPYPDFAEKMTVAFEDGSTLITTANDLKTLRDKNRYSLSANGFPSFWGAAEISEKNDFCIGENEIAKRIYIDGKDWLWWHPRALNFELGTIEKSYFCWESDGENVEGVVLDLRDTAGGDFPQTYAMAYQFQVPMPPSISRLISDGEISMDQLREQEGPPVEKTKAGYLQTLQMTTPNAAKQVTPWTGRLVVITNGLCGSACDLLAYHLQSRKNTCLYGTPTAGRVVGSSEINITANLLISVPMREILRPDGKRWEGQSIIPQQIGNGGPAEAIEACGD